MKPKLSFALALGLAGFLPAASMAKPPSMPVERPPTARPQALPKAGATKKRPTKGAATQASGDTIQGLIKSMHINKDGTIREFFMRPAGRSDTIKVRGCGAESKAHPMLNWAFTHKRLVYVWTASNGCFNSVEIQNP